MNLKEILVSTLLPAIKTIGKAQLAEVLAKIKQNNTQEVYENTLKSAYSTFSLLDVEAIKTKTKIDDGIIDIVLETVKDAADEDGIEL